VFSGSDYRLVGFSFVTVNHSYGIVRISASYSDLLNYRISNKMTGNVYFPKYPNKKSSIKLSMTNELIDFEVSSKRDTTKRKLGVSVFGENEDSTDVKLWEMDKLDNEAKNLDYIKIDSSNSKFTFVKAANLGESCESWGKHI